MKVASEHCRRILLATGKNKRFLMLCLDSSFCHQIYFDIEEGSKITAEKLYKNLEEHGVLVMPDGLYRSVCSTKNHAEFLKHLYKLLSL